VWELDSIYLRDSQIHTATDLNSSQTRASEGFFPGGEQKWIFPDAAKNSFSWRAKSGKISFHPLETKKKTYFSKTVT